MSDDKQLFQVQNILETLIEATDHFSILIKKKELSQSVYIFSSIVEGSQAIVSLLQKKDNRFNSETRRLEKSLVTITGELEKNNLMKVSEIIQFSLRPLLVKLNQSFVEKVGNHKTEKQIAIGIFHSIANPKDIITEERLQATLNESVQQNTVLYFFTSEDIDFEGNMIHAFTWQENNWKRVTAPFPDVINNVGGGKRSQAERKLQRIVPFTGFHVGNKFTLPKRMLKNRKFAELLVPFTVCINEKAVYNFMQKNNHVVFKALKSNRGENIYFVNKKGSRYIMMDQKKERIMSEEKFRQFVDQVILAEKGDYIIQRYIHTRTKADEPYHFRAHVQKDHHAEWRITHIYPRIGSKKSNLSNISAEGRVEDLPAFLRREYGGKQGAKYEKEIRALLIDVVTHLDKLYGMGLNELGIDFAIDDTGRIWMHEANNGPQTAYHEEKRAINYIGYAKYIAENGVMHTSISDIEAAAKGQFQARNTDLPLAEYSKDLTVGVLLGEKTEVDILTFLAQKAQEKEIPLFTFTPKDIDYGLGLIRGSFYEKAEWIEKVAEFPSVIIDQLKMRSSKEDMLVYEELEEIPFTNEWVTDATSRSTLCKIMQKDDETANNLADYQTVKRALHVFQLLERCGQVQLKQENMSYANPTYTIKTLDDKQYEVLTRKSSKIYSENQLRNFINHLIEEEKYIVQEYAAMKGTLPEIHIHMMKNGWGEWQVVSGHIKTTIVEADKTIIREEQAWETFVDENHFGCRVKEQTESIAVEAARVMDDIMNEALGEISFIYTVNEEGAIKIIEANPAGPQIIYDGESYATAILEYAGLIALK